MKSLLERFDARAGRIESSTLAARTAGAPYGVALLIIIVEDGSASDADVASYAREVLARPRGSDWSHR